ncbi:hypothetical protein FOL47_006789 [Perkinsus chesapeaki]|uniref:N-acetyltransferase domain-containing protein n=1 Tax=Perkinsus chesapeaki TaxID=330153 RepID=A0A7J6LQ89_PERCH|nr:hypothetical protein FOL47_006789 [Perkinsus chesapeaki]
MTSSLCCLPVFIGIILGLGAEQQQAGLRGLRPPRECIVIAINLRLISSLFVNRDATELKYRPAEDGDLMNGAPIASSLPGTRKFVAIDNSVRPEFRVVAFVEFVGDQEPPDYILRKLSGAEKRKKFFKIAEVFVAKPWRGRGVGSIMLPQALKWIKSENSGTAAVYLSVKPGNKNAIKLYKKTNFTLLSTGSLQTQVFLYKYSDSNGTETLSQGSQEHD